MGGVGSKLVILTFFPQSFPHSVSEFKGIDKHMYESDVEHVH